MEKQIRIALINDYLVNASFQQGVINGVASALPEKGVQLFIFVGGGIKKAADDDYAQYRNFIFDLITKELFDGIIVNTTVGNFISREEFALFFERYKGVPIIFFGPGPGKYSQVIVDNKQGMEAIIHHFINNHHYKRIAFITGPKGNLDAEERLAAYKKELADAGLPLDPELICQGDFTLSSGIATVKTLLDVRKVQFEALVASNDNMALGAKQELESRGYSIPEDIALAGFDDILEASSVLPSLTTARQPFELFGKKILDNLTKMIQKKEATKIEYIPAKIVIRQSCGCLSSRIIDENLKYGEGTEMDAAAYYATHKSEHLKELADKCSLLGIGIDKEQTSSLLDAFYAHIFNEQNTIVFMVLKKAIFQSIKNNENIDVWQELLTFIRHLFSPLLSIRQTIEKAEILFHQARLIIDDIQTIQKNRNFIDSRMQMDQVLAVGDTLTTTIENTELRRVIYETFPTLSIKNFLISNFVQNENGSECIEKAHLIAQICNGQSKSLEGSDIVYATNKLFPTDINTYTSRVNFLLPLLYRENKLGYVIFERLEAQATLYSALTSQVGRSLYTSKLIEKILTTEKEIQERSNNIEALVLPMIDSIQRVKNLCENQSSEAINLNTMSEQSSEKVKQSTKITEDLSKILSETNLLINSINDISETVDILSLNAAIEAVHAGTYGKGFSVIASEIRKLSDKTKYNVNQVNQFLGSISKGIKNFVSANQEVSLVFKRLYTTINNMTTSLNEVSAKMMKLGDSSNTILNVMRPNK